ncbi:MAG: TlyA family RNA methyltransferase [Oscillospiraceae bacterium]|nr:TlyA family RNA methyltransferase [Oscillospiraceae bacterium]
MTLRERLTADGWFSDEREMTAFVMAGRVLADGRPVHSLSEKVGADAEIRVREYYKTKYAGKGGLKLEHALTAFAVAVSGKTTLDCGASTGGFTDCLLAFGAGLVYAVDVGAGQLAGKLALDPRVVNMERVNLSDGALTRLDPKPELITLDLSYLSLRGALPVAAEILAPGGEVVALVKPLFETESPEARRLGKIDDGEYRKILTGLCAFAETAGFAALGATHSPVTGNSGTVEFFLHLRLGGGLSLVTDADADAAVAAGLALGRFSKG